MVLSTTAGIVAPGAVAEAAGESVTWAPAPDGPAAGVAVVAALAV
jgi:hypothetical protein